MTTSTPDRARVPDDPPIRDTGELKGVRILIADPDLGSALKGAALEEAREHAVLPEIQLAPGKLDVDQLHRAENVREPLHGFLLLSGSLMVTLGLSARACARLITPHELVFLGDLQSDTVPATLDWSALTEARLALIDARLHTIARQWPPVLSAIVFRAAQQTRNLFLQKAISQLPRVEDRLLALFWSIADKQGVVRRDGVWIDLPLTHATLATMVGAQRPTVSIGLGRLAEAGLLRPQADGWLLAPDSKNALHPLRPTD